MGRRGRWGSGAVSETGAALGMQEVFLEGWSGVLGVKGG